MIVYHGSDVEVQTPDTRHSLHRLDFGAGFYVTTVKEQAQRWAKRKAVLHGKNTGIVSVFEMTETDGFNICNFSNNLDEWIDFVCSCRNGEEIFKKYDVIMGKVANDKVFRVVDMYKQGIWDKKRAIQEFKIYTMYDQIAFISQNAIDKMLKFKTRYEVL